LCPTRYSRQRGAFIDDRARGASSVDGTYDSEVIFDPDSDPDPTALAAAAAAQDKLAARLADLTREMRAREANAPSAALAAAAGARADAAADAERRCTAAARSFQTLQARTEQAALQQQPRTAAAGGGKGGEEADIADATAPPCEFDPPRGLFLARPDGADEELTLLNSVALMSIIVNYSH